MTTASRDRDGAAATAPNSCPPALPLNSTRKRPVTTADSGFRPRRHNNDHDTRPRARPADRPASVPRVRQHVDRPVRFHADRAGVVGVTAPNRKGGTVTAGTSGTGLRTDQLEEKVPAARHAHRVASQDPARPASSSAIDISESVNAGVRLANGDVRPGTCSLNVAWTHPSLTHVKRRASSSGQPIG